MQALRSWAAGTAGLWVVLAVSVMVSRARPLRVLTGAERRGLVRTGLAACVLQAGHFFEEFVSGFPSEFPRALGLSSWSRSSFVAFNLVWLVVWTISVGMAPRGYRLAEWPLWFLSLALVLNGLAHPVLALRAGGYFPGLATSVLAGAAGVLLLSRLMGLTRRAGTAAQAG